MIGLVTAEHIIYFDIKKTSDIVPHKQLLLKVGKAGIEKTYGAISEVT